MCGVCVKKKKSFKRKRLYITSVSECWRQNSARMPCGTWQECALWLNIPVSHPAVRKLLATRDNRLVVDLLTRWTCLFKNSISPLGLLWESRYTRTHMQPPSSFLFSNPGPQASSLPIGRFLSLNKRREVPSSPPTVSRPPGQFHLSRWKQLQGVCFLSEAVMLSVVLLVADSLLSLFEKTTLPAQLKVGNRSDSRRFCHALIHQYGHAGQLLGVMFKLQFD